MLLKDDKPDEKAIGEALEQLASVHEQVMAELPEAYLQAIQALPAEQFTPQTLLNLAGTFASQLNDAERVRLGALNQTLAEKGEVVISVLKAMASGRTTARSTGRNRKRFI